MPKRKYTPETAYESNSLTRRELLIGRSVSLVDWRKLAMSTVEWWGDLMPIVYKDPKDNLVKPRRPLYSCKFYKIAGQYIYDVWSLDHPYQITKLNRKNISPEIVSTYNKDRLNGYLAVVFCAQVQEIREGKSIDVGSAVGVDIGLSSGDFSAVVTIAKDESREDRYVVDWIKEKANSRSFSIEPGRPSPEEMQRRESLIDQALRIATKKQPKEPPSTFSLIELD